MLLRNGNNNEAFVFFYHPDHLGSSSYITDVNGEVTQHIEYFAFGETFLEEHSNTDRTPYLFNGKELDEETGLYYYGARYYDAKTSLWQSVDPLGEKTMEPYIFVSNNPIKAVDPDGKEKIIVTGGEYTSKSRYKYNFVEPSIKQLKAYKAAANGESVTWAVINAGYSDDDIKKFQMIAKNQGVDFVMINSSEELNNYLNSKSTSSGDVSEARKADAITDVSVFGHGYVGSMELAHGQSNQKDFSYDISDISSLSSDAFNSANIELYTCNPATPLKGDDLWSSFAGELAKKTKTKVYGYFGRSDYAKMNIGESYGNKINRFGWGFNTAGSQSLPTGGTKSDGTSSQRYYFDKIEDKKND